MDCRVKPGNDVDQCHRRPLLRAGSRSSNSPAWSWFEPRVPDWGNRASFSQQTRRLRKIFHHDLENVGHFLYDRKWSTRWKSAILNCAPTLPQGRTPSQPSRRRNRHGERIFISRSPRGDGSPVATSFARRIVAGDANATTPNAASAEQSHRCGCRARSTGCVPIRNRDGPRNRLSPRHAFATFGARALAKQSHHAAMASIPSAPTHVGSVTLGETKPPRPGNPGRTNSPGSAPNRPHSPALPVGPKRDSVAQHRIACRLMQVTFRRADPGDRGAAEGGKPR
jgi:hypothetical protein